MGLYKKKEKGKIINTGRHLPKPKITDSLRFMQDRTRIVGNYVKKQSQIEKTIFYGGSALNLHLGENRSRPSYDFDIYSNKPKRHALQLEKHIDNSLGVDFAYIEKSSEHPLFRVKIKPYDITEADYNKNPGGFKPIQKKGLWVVPLGYEKKKREKMLRDAPDKRTFNTYQDLGMIGLHELSKRRRRLL